MKEIKIAGVQIQEALAQIDTITELSLKERGCLRLLTEEMFSLCHELLDTCTLNFEIKQNGGQYSLSGITKTWIDDVARDQLLSVSSSGKNAAIKGAKGIIGAVLEVFSKDKDSLSYNVDWAYGMHDDGASRMWMLSRYMEKLGEAKGESKWDGLEKSIIASFADDVSISVRNDKLIMTITKTFSAKNS